MKYHAVVERADTSLAVVERADARRVGVERTTPRRAKFAESDEEIRSSVMYGFPRAPETNTRRPRTPRRLVIGGGACLRCCS